MIVDDLIWLQYPPPAPHNFADSVGRIYQGPSVLLVWVVQLSTGQVLWSRSFPSDGATIIDVIANHDGTSVAVGRATCCPNSGFTTTVYGAGGGQVGTLDGHAGGYTATGSSWDGSRMILAAGANETEVIWLSEA